MDKQKDIRVLTAGRKDILTKIVIDNRINLVTYPLYLALNIKKLQFLSEKVLKKNRVVNLYNNKFDRGQLWERSNPTIR